MQNLDYGIIGNCQSAALVSKEGSIEWCCLPSFDSPSIFASLLDRERGGHFIIRIRNGTVMDQKYLRNSAILSTRMRSEDGELEVLDFMPRYHHEGEYYTPPDIIRHIRIVWGAPRIIVEYKPALEYAQGETRTVARDGYIKSFTLQEPYDSLYLYTNLDTDAVISGEPVILAGDAFFLLSYNQKLLNQTVERSDLKLQRTLVYWLNWVERTHKFASYTSQILRSAITLKLLSYDRSGAVLAAVTTSLPESTGEERNWDYRFCWIRDASMVIRVMTALGHRNMTTRYMKFIVGVIPEKDEKIQIMYGINGQKILTERTLDHLSGYLDSRPVRIGNDAYHQKQNDIYGVLMDVLHTQFTMYETSLRFSEDLWTITRGIVRTVEKNWRNPDRGIWEIRGGDRHFTFSKLLCWTTIDRAARIAQLIKMNAYVEKWTALRDVIKQDIIENAWNGEIGAFVQYYGGDELDASNLLMEQYGFIEADDRRYISTVLKTKDQLLRDGLMYRYINHDDFGLPKSSFTICTFWMIQSLYRIGHIDESRELFDSLLTKANHLGLFSEDIEFETGMLLGNFPQAYSHLALIETAVMLGGGKLNEEQKILSRLHRD